MWDQINHLWWDQGQICDMNEISLYMNSNDWDNIILLLINLNLAMASKPNKAYSVIDEEEMAR